MTAQEQLSMAIQAGAINLKEKEFSTGSRGFTVFGKALINGKRYQFSGNLVEIGSKPDAGDK